MEKHYDNSLFTKLFQSSTLEQLMNRNRKRKFINEALTRVQQLRKKVLKKGDQINC